MKKEISKKTPDPFQTLGAWFYEELAKAPLKYPASCVVSTIGLDGFPNARTVSIKEVKPPHFIFTTHLDAKKGLEIQNNNKVALTFWWDHSQRQIRVQGIAKLLSDEEADAYFRARSKSAQAICSVSHQSKPLQDEKNLRNAYTEKLVEYAENPIPRPSHWGGFKILPARIEFLELKESRFHNRICYTLVEDVWQVTQLQP